jgi:subtilase family serine protease
MSGHVHPAARAEYDQGRVSPSLQLSYATLTLAPSAAQQTALDQLLADQQNPTSPNYHRWITPEQYAQRFGASDADLSTISTWLQSQGLKVDAIARGRNWIAFSGTAAQVEAAFQIEIHNYLVNGDLHFANAAEPSIPAALGGVIRGIRGLNDFRMKPSSRLRVHPDYTSSRGVHQIVPNDFATIYDVNPLYTAGINGSGQKMVIAGQTEINLPDIEQFRSMYGLPANNPTPMLVPGSRNPGISSTDLPEADLDLEW